MAEQSKTRRKWVWNNRPHRCHWCDQKLGWSGENMMTVDHLIPKSRGGSNRRTNLVASCYPCNQAKASRTPEEFAAIMAVSRGALVPPPSSPRYRR